MQHGLAPVLLALFASANAGVKQQPPVGWRGEWLHLLALRSQNQNQNQRQTDKAHLQVQC